MSALFQLGDYVLAGGVASLWKIECDALGEDDWAALAFMLATRLHEPFGRVIGVPRGGWPFAEALEPYTTSSRSVLVVDDVWTTGTSMNNFIASVPIVLPYQRAVVFARNAVPDDVTALFVVPT